MSALLDDLKRLHEYSIPKEPRVLTVDIETSPNIVYSWGLFKQNIAPVQVIESTRMLCFAAKWHGDKKLTFRSEFHNTREEMVNEAWRLYDEADVVQTYNGIGFDNPHLMREFLLMGLGPPSPWVDIDLLQVNRKRFRFTSNKLVYVTEYLGLDAKMDAGGMELWKRVMAGDPAAWEKMRRYNMRDVVITEQLGDVLSPWITSPHMGQWTGNTSCCYRCGSDQLAFVGLVYGKTTAYPSFVCAVCNSLNKMLRSGQTRAA